MSQRDRRRDPYPWTWEPTAILLVVTTLVLIVGLQTGRTLANALATGGWAYASPGAWISTLPILLAGDAAAGLDPVPRVVARPSVLWPTVGLVEVALFLPFAYVVRGVAMRWAPSRPRGFATPAQVDRVLGLTRLRRVAPLIRPDLHAATRRGGR